MITFQSIITSRFKKSKWIFRKIDNWKEIHQEEHAHREGRICVIFSFITEAFDKNKPLGFFLFQFFIVFLDIFKHIKEGKEQSRLFVIFRFVRRHDQIDML